MSRPNVPLRWLTVVAIVQSTLLFFFSTILAIRIRAIQRTIFELLLTSSVPVEVVDQANQTFTPILNELIWLFWGGLILTAVGYSFLRYLIIKNWTPPPL